MTWTWIDITVCVLSFIAGMMVVAGWGKCKPTRRDENTRQSLSELWEPRSNKPIPNDVIVENRHFDKRRLNMREADEVSTEDLEVAGEFYDRIMREQQD